MSQYNSLRATIDANIKTNGNEEITGAVLNSVLNAMVTTLGAGYQPMGVATPTDPGSAQTPDYKCFYLATTPGTYTYLGELVVNKGEVALLKYDSEWHKEVIGVASQESMYDGDRRNYILGESMYDGDKPFIEADHLCNYSVGFVGYVKNTAWDAAWVAILPETSAIEVSGIEAVGYISCFSDFAPTTENFISRSTSGTIPAGTRLVIINLQHSTNPGGFANLKVKQLGGVADKDTLRLASRGAFLDYGHLLSYTNQSTMSYSKSAIYDALVIPLGLNGLSSISVTGCTIMGYYHFFSDFDLAVGHFLGRNTSGNIPNGAVVCVVNLLREDNPGGYKGADLIINTNFVKNADLLSMFEGIQIIKNLINTNDLLTGYILNNGQFVENANGVCTNKIVFQDGVTYAFQNLLHYGPAHKIFVCHFDAEDNFIGSTGVKAVYEPGSSVGNALYTYSKAEHPATAYCRIVLRTSSSQSTDFSNCQVEVGNQYTEVVGYGAKLGFVDTSGVKRRKIRLLSIGNSYSQDALAYVPFILQNMGVDVDIQIGILMQSSASLQMHVENFLEEDNPYTFNLYNGGSAWVNASNKSIQWALDNYDWDIVCLQQSSQGSFSWNTYQPWCNKLINLVSAYVGYPVKFIWYQPQARPASTNSGANWSDATITEHYENTAQASERILNETSCEVVVPVGTAIQNARSISALKALGAYADNENNTSGLGYLTPNDGVHLQEGLPCQIAAYTFILSLLAIYGLSNYSINGETTRVTSDWTSGKNIPSPHGACIGSTDENCLIAQKCAIMAIRHPYQVTDMNYIVDPES